MVIFLIGIGNSHLLCCLVVENKELINVLGTFEMSCTTFLVESSARQGSLWNSWHIEHKEERKFIYSGFGHMS